MGLQAVPTPARLSLTQLHLLAFAARRAVHPLGGARRPYCCPRTPVETATVGSEAWSNMSGSARRGFTGSRPRPVQQTAACNALHTMESRLARWLLQTRDRVYSDVLPLTQEFLSQMLGVRRTTITLVARQLEQAGVIQTRRGRIVVVDRKGLEDVACECYAIVRDRLCTAPLETAA